MIEIIHMLYAYTPIELKVVILACLIGGFYFFYKDYKKSRGFDRAIQKCKNGKEIEREVMRFYDKR